MNKHNRFKQKQVNMYTISLLRAVKNDMKINIFLFVFYFARVVKCFSWKNCLFYIIVTLGYVIYRPLISW